MFISQCNAEDTYLKHKKSQSISAGCEFNVAHFRNDDNKLKYYTGLHTFSLLMVVFNFVQDHVSIGKSLTKFQQFMTVMVKFSTIYYCYGEIKTGRRASRLSIQSSYGANSDNAHLDTGSTVNYSEASATSATTANVDSVITAAPCS